MVSSLTHNAIGQVLSIAREHSLALKTRLGIWRATLSAAFKGGPSGSAASRQAPWGASVWLDSIILKVFPNLNDATVIHRVIRQISQPPSWQESSPSLSYTRKQGLQIRKDAASPCPGSPLRR